jgi:hypothetical protein
VARAARLLPLEFLPEPTVPGATLKVAVSAALAEAAAHGVLLAAMAACA